MHDLGSSVSDRKAFVVNICGLVLFNLVSAERPFCFSSLRSPGGSGDQLLLVCCCSSVIFALLPWKRLTALFVFVLLHAQKR